MVKYQFEVDDDTWEEWKETVPRSKSLEQRIIELIEADRDGRVQDPTAKVKVNDGEPQDPAPEPEPTTQEHEPVSDRVREAVADVANGWDDSDERLQLRRAAAERILTHAVETDEAVGKSSEIVDDVYAELEIPGQSRETFWRKNVRAVLKEHGEYDNARHGYRVDL